MDIRGHDAAKIRARTDLDGIVALLTERCGGNVHDHGLVDITSLSGGKRRVVLLTSYTIRSLVGCGRGDCHPSNWVVETSVNGTVWTVVDEQNNNYALNGADRKVYFDIHESNWCAGRFVRLRQTGRNHADTRYLRLTSFEVFGDLYE
jgi:hypothetical protein